MPGAHKLLAASKASVWAGKDGKPGCPASAVLALLCPEKESGDAANIGTQAHAAAEAAILEADGYYDAVSAVALAAPDHVISAMNNYIAYIKGKKDAGLKVELEVKLAWSVLIGGTSDAIITDDDFMVIECADLKTGREEVGPESGQIGTYLVAKRKSLGLKGRDYSYVGTIVQGEHVKSKQWSHEELDAWEDKMLNVNTIVVNILSAGVPALNYEFASDENCYWCPAKGLCHAHAASMFPADGPAKSSFDHMKKACVPSKKPATLSAEEKAAILLAKPRIEKWLSEVEKLALAEAQSGVAFPGLKIGTKKAGDRKWMAGVPIDTIVCRLIEEGKLDRSKLFTKPDLISPAQAEKLGAPVELLDKLSIRSEGKAALVPAETITFTEE